MDSRPPYSLRNLAHEIISAFQLIFPNDRLNLLHLRLRQRTKLQRALCQGFAPQPMMIAS